MDDVVSEQAPNNLDRTDDHTRFVPGGASQRDISDTHDVQNPAFQCFKVISIFAAL